VVFVVVCMCFGGAGVLLTVKAGKYTSQGKWGGAGSDQRGLRAVPIPIHQEPEP
jgi:hypothetical protein